MSVKRKLDWIRGNPFVVAAIIIGIFGVPMSFIGVIDDGGITNNLPVLVVVALTNSVFVWSIRAMIRTGEGRRYPYALTFQQWQDHELPDPRETHRLHRMRSYCLRRGMPFKTESYHGVPYRLRFLYEEDLHEANLAT